MAKEKVNAEEENNESGAEKLGKEIVKEERKVIKELKKNPWIAATFVFAVIAMILLFFVSKGGVGGISSNTVGEKAVSFVNNELLQGQGTVTLKSVSESGGLYKVTVDYNGQEVPTYFTKDGKYYLGTQMVPLTLVAGDTANSNPATPAAPKEILKSDKPKVELFVMTHCPFGTQAEKGYLPAIKLLGNKIDAKVRFVHYFMHGDREEQESYAQLCIREENSAKYNDYLSCFLEDGDSSRCLKKVGLSEASINTCKTSKAKEYYAADSKLSNEYGVQGSPTLVINGAQVEFYPRSADNALKLICASFNTPPAECSQTLSTDNPSTGFGTAVTPASATNVAAGSAAGCVSA